MTAWHCRPLGATLRLARLARGMKQAHAAEHLGCSQPTLSRIERGGLHPTDRLRARILDFISARLDPQRDAALRRLVEGAPLPVHLICDLSHRLLAASGQREHEWRRTTSELRGVSVWR